MSHSIVTFRDRTCVMCDRDIVTVIHLILDAVQQSSPPLQPPDAINALLEAWSTLMESYRPGRLDLNLDTFILTEEDRHALVNLLLFYRSGVNRFGPMVLGSYLKGIVNAPARFEFLDRPTANVLVAWEALIELLDPEWVHGGDAIE